ncbi:MAG: trimeric intracellular cation channel family protein [Deferribacteraceae bacterium]|jgi:uncharacterized membrane protein YeiH|nr:trimeric intracellular cation channel family protein [Deferribacteraceae bacterium]
MLFIYLFDLLGTFTFAVSGALLGVKKEMDIYGLFVLAFTAAVGGGTVREIALGSIPPFLFTDPNYLYATVAAVMLVIFFNKKVERHMRYFTVMDAVGLGVFTVIGASKAINAGLSWFAALPVALLTCTGGGMLRDIFSGEIPIVLRKEVYASASLTGALLFLLLRGLDVPDSVNAFFSAAAVVGIRLLTLKKNFHLPKV